MVRDVLFLTDGSGFGPGRRGMAATGASYRPRPRSDPARRAKGRQSAPGRACRPPDHASQLRADDAPSTVSSATYGACKISGQPRPGARSAPLKLYVEQVLTGRVAHG